IYRFSMNAEISNVRCLTATEAEVVEVIANEGSKATRKKVKDLDFPDNAKIGGIVRGEKGFIVTGETQILTGDKVVIFALPKAIKKIDKFFK
ncbi:MAG: Trk system potassium transporter TrkA, partial [Prolixibacteraceae bacterium]|nr:Trk system potassium transporter TrkA [Prolixibacteraceae bacterium]